MSPEDALARLVAAAGAGPAAARASTGPPAIQQVGPATPEPGAGAVSLSTARLDVTRMSCSPVEGVDPQALGLTYRFQAPDDGPAAPVTVSFTGRRLDVTGPTGPRDTFTTRATVDPVLPGTGQVTLTTRVLDLAPGEWQVAAAPVDAAGRPSHVPVTARGTTGFAPVVRVRAPGVRLGAWPGMVTLGTVVALVTQAALARSRDEAALQLSALTLLACIIGVLGAKTYYLATHRNENNGLLTVGMSLQGFVLGSIATLIVAALLTDLSVGTSLDLTIPGLVFGMAIGRLGCFFGGCCAGRPTASRWGLWSSDRRLGVRRIPVQLVESAVAAAIGLVALSIVLAVPTAPAGAVFVGGVAAYTLARQLLFPLRDLPRATTYGRVIMIVVTSTALVAVVVGSLVT